MKVRLLANLKVAPNEIHKIGEVFEGNRSELPDWLEVEIKRNRYVEIIEDVIAAKAPKVKAPKPPVEKVKLPVEKKEKAEKIEKVEKEITKAKPVVMAKHTKPKPRIKTKPRTKLKRKLKKSGDK